MGRFRRIMHASDFSPASRAAFARAIDLAKSNRAELTVVHVLTPVMPVAGVYASATSNDLTAYGLPRASSFVTWRRPKTKSCVPVQALVR